MDSNVDPDEISLLDLLVTAAESWKLLIFGPIAAGLVGLGVAFSLPSTYVSTAVLSLPEDSFNNAIAQAVASSDDFLLGVAQSAGRLQESNAQSEVAERVRELRAQIQVTVNRKSRLLTVSVTAPTPEQAQALNQKLVDALLAESKPTGSRLQRLQTELANAEASAKGYQAAQAAVTRWLAKPLPGNTTEAFVQALVALQANNESTENRIFRIKESIAGLDQSVVVQQPDRPLQPTSPKRSLIAVLTALAAGFALLLYVFIRQALRQSAQDPESARKLQAIKQAFAGRRSTSAAG